MRFRARAATAVIAALVVAASCSGSSAIHRDRAAPTTTTVAIPTGRPATFAAHGSVEQVWLTGAPARTPAALWSRHGRVAQEPTDARGSLIFRNVAPGDGYRVVIGAGAATEVSAPLRVTTPQDAPPESFYEHQRLVDGYQYVTTRDGTTLAITVRLPGPIDKGPYPTVIEYSGYAAADPGSPQPSTLIASTLDYATVGVNIRGTGCSGGAFQFFEPLQGTDGYDVVEAVAAQPWVLHHHVGLIGISYPGISQLFVARTRPPHLAAIAPLSPIDDTYRGTLYPGGILNDGFAVSWAKDRQHDAEAAPDSGQAWAATRIRGGDRVCKANQALRGQAPNVLDLAHMAKWFTPRTPIVRNDFQAIPTLADLAPASFAHDIDVPVFLSSAWHDEQTGDHVVNMLDAFFSAPVKRFTLINGNHSEPLTPDILIRWHEFLELYVAERVPKLPVGFRVFAPTVFKAFFGPVAGFPPDRFAQYHSYADALAAYQRDPEVRILYENGAGCPAVAIGAPCPTFERDYARWPIPGLVPTTYHLSDGGRLASAAPTARGVDTYQYAGDGQGTTWSGDSTSIWVGLPKLVWRSPAAGHAVSYVSDPLRETTVMAGTARVDLWVQADAPDVDLQVQLTDVRPDGTEYYVQAGWLRASHRRLDPGGDTALRAVPTHAEADAAPLPAGRFTEVSIEMLPFAHVFHAGSRIRLIVDVPGSTRPFWKFDVLRYDHAVTVQVAHGGDSDARITLPVVPGEGRFAPAAAPPCPALRGQPCRPYVPFTNQARS